MDVRTLNQGVMKYSSIYEPCYNRGILTSVSLRCTYFCSYYDLNVWNCARHIVASSFQI
jgi:hypothetical protein